MKGPVGRHRQRVLARAGHLVELVGQLYAPLPAASLGYLCVLLRNGVRHLATEVRQIQKDANAKDEETNVEEHRALRYDLGEGFLELGLVLCSLYFLARKIFFPVFGVIAAVAGACMGLWGMML